MRLFIGLGNPGQLYKNNRHNLGFMILDKISEIYSKTEWRDKFKGKIIHCNIDGKKTILFKPSDYMNNSGFPSYEVIKFYKIKPEDIFIFFDDIELSPGKIRVKFGGGHAGHNGIRNIISQVGVNFWRIKLGIGHPGSKQDVGDYVLSNFSKLDSEWVEEIINNVAINSHLLINLDTNNFMNRVSLKMNTKELPLSPRNIIINKEKG